jgi:hypothetical protein
MYLHVLKAIELRPTPRQDSTTPLEFDEEVDGKRSGLWALQAEAPDALQGTWQSPDGSRRLAISLHKADVLWPDHSDCDTDSAGPYNAAALRNLRTHAMALSAPRRLGEMSYQTVSRATVSSWQLTSALGGKTALNQMFGDAMREHIVAYLTCPTRDGGEPDYSASIYPSLVVRGYVTVTTALSSDCGGAYPSVSVEEETWDLASGKPIDIASLIIWAKQGGLPERLRRLVVESAIKSREKGMSPQDKAEFADCREVLRGKLATYSISLAQDGIKFLPHFPHVVQACESDATIAFQAMLPFMNQAGRRFVARLMRP